MEVKVRKVGILGVGHVGAHCAYSLALQGIVDELVLVDANEAKVISECQDLRDAVMYMPHNVKISVGTFADLADCDILVNAIGNISLLVGGGDRNDEMNYTVAQVKATVDKVMASGFNGIVISITNPCDVITDLFHKMSGLPKNKVFGTGTGLDTSRLVAQLALQTGVDHQSISAYMIGAHGDQLMAVWSGATFGGVPLSALEKKDARFAFDKAELQQKAIKGGWVTMHGKHCTEFGICTTLARMVRSVLHDEKRIMPASALLEGEYGESGVYIGVPCIIGKNGLEQVMELSLSAEEKVRFHECCEAVRKNIKKAEVIAPAK